MQVIVKDSYEEISEIGAKIIANAIRKKPSLVLGLATGSTPIGMYKELIRMHKEENLDFSKVTTFNLDEYVGLPTDHDQSYHYFMCKNLFDHVNIDMSKVHVPSGLVTGKDAQDYCQWYENEIKKAGGIDIQVLGLGSDGHIAFNEPGSSLASRTRIVALTEETIDDNSRFFEKKEDVPQFSITMGVGTVMEARYCLIMAKGESKAKAVKAFVEGPVSSQITASALQMHPKVTAFFDETAASKLERLDYYKFAYQSLHEKEMTG